MSQDESRPEEPGENDDATPSGALARPPSEHAGDLAAVAAATHDFAAVEPEGLIANFKLSRLRSKTELAAVAIVLDARLEEMQRQADAAAHESKAYWDGKTAQVVSAMKTVVQARLRSIETERMSNRFESIETAYNLFADKVRDVEAGSLPDELREELIRKLHANLKESIARIEKDTLADSYDLKD